jgi:hypothetical protein
MYTEQQLVDFGNYLLKTYGVQVFSNDGQNVPIYQRQVSDADFANWKVGDKVGYSNGDTWLPSQFNIGDKVKVHLKGLSSENDGTMREVDYAATILAVHFYQGKVKYDLEVPIFDEPPTRIYNIDSIFVLQA